MKRVESACLLQTLKFILDPTISEQEAREKVLNEVKKFKESLDPSRTVLVKEVCNDDGTFIISIKKQVGDYSVGTYFD